MLKFQKKFCRGCNEGKLSHDRVPRTSEGSRFRATEPGEKWFLDTVGPFHMRTMKNQVGFLLMTDDKSRYRFVFLYRSKTEATDWLIAKLKRLKNQNKFDLKVLHSDGGTEIVNGKLRDFVARLGATIELSNPGFPQQNGVAERSNRVTMDGARAMLHAAKLPFSYWGHAVETKVFLLNRTPCRVNGQWIVPYTVFWKKKPKLMKLRIFGSRGWGKRSTGDDRKSFPRGHRCQMLGNSLHLVTT